MTFLNPAMLWSLAVMAPLVAIYFLKVRPRRKTSTAYFLWDTIFQQRTTSSLFQRLRDLWSLILMALAAAAVCLALARPEFSTENKDLLIVVDNTASMGADDGGTSRLEMAKKVATELVQGLNSHQRAAIATVSDKLNFQSHLSENPRELMEAIEKIQVVERSLDLAALKSDAIENDNDTDQETDAATNPSEESVASTQSGQTSSKGSSQDDSQNKSWHDNHRTVFISDGCFESELPKKVELIKVSQPLKNVGLVAADMAYLPGGQNRAAFYFQVASSNKKVVEVDLTLNHVDENGIESLQKVIPLEIQPGTSPPETFEIDSAEPGRWMAMLEVKDALDVDNVAYLAVDKPPPIRVAVDESNRFFFENSVLAFAENDGLMTLVTEQPDIVLASSATPASPLAVIFKPEGESKWWSELGDEVEVGIVRESIKDHPAIRYIDPGTMPFALARKLKPAAGSQVLLTDDQNIPLIYKCSDGEQSAIVINMDAAATEFYFSAWFPVLIHSAATHLSGREVPIAASYRPGQSVPIPTITESANLETRKDDSNEPTLAAGEANDNAIDDEAEAATFAINPNQSIVTDPSGSKTTVTGKWFSKLDQVGFYEMKNRGGNWIVGSSLMSAEESLLNNGSAKETVNEIRRGQSPAYWLTLLAIFVLTAECVLYHRRKVG